MTRFLCEEGQGTVEAALLIPTILLSLMLLIQPGIILYDRMVMKSAAAETCRILATKSAAMSSDTVENYVRNRLGAIPQQENFHVHEGGCSWEVTLDGDDQSDVVSVGIRGQIAPLPLIGTASGLLGLVNAEGNFETSVEVSMRTKGSWLAETEQGLDPEGWVQAWN